ncbi:hypothetical protein LINPERHAP2_LOCUS24446 [Linum perenne]
MLRLFVWLKLRSCYINLEEHYWTFQVCPFRPIILSIFHPILY